MDAINQKLLLLKLNQLQSLHYLKCNSRIGLTLILKNGSSKVNSRNYKSLTRQRTIVQIFMMDSLTQLQINSHI